MKFDYIYYRGQKIPISPRDLTEEETIEYAKHDAIVNKVYTKMKPLKEKYQHKLKTGRWIHCKYCYKNTKPIVNWFDALIKCSECDAGLWPLGSERNILEWIEDHP